jgi:hypothetical protein
MVPRAGQPALNNIKDLHCQTVAKGIIGRKRLFPKSSNLFVLLDLPTLVNPP